MKRNLILLCSLFAATALISSCAQDAMEPEVDAAATVAETRAYGDKTPKVMMYIEVNDTNPLNTMLYRMNGEPFIDITTIFAANIRANGSEPALWLNDNVTQLLIPSPATSTTTGHYKYVQPIRQDGGKVLLTILGDHQGVGVANLTAANQAKFAKILTWAVEEYGLDGIDFDDTGHYFRQTFRRTSADGCQEDRHRPGSHGNSDDLIDHGYGFYFDLFTDGNPYPRAGTLANTLV